MLIITATLKLASLPGPSRVLESIDPVFGVPTKTVFVWVALLEIVVALALIRWLRPPGALWVSAWMGLNLLLYRGARFLAGEHNACPCLGSAADGLGLRPAAVDAALLSFSAFLFFGSGALLWKLHQSPAGPTDRERETLHQTSR